MNIFITFGGLSWQKGSAAQLESLVAVVRSMRPDVEIVLESHAFDLDAPRARELGIGIVGHPGFGHRSPHEGSLRLVGIHARLMVWAALKRLGCRWDRLVRHPAAQSLLKADLVVDLSGDSYRDRPGGFALAHNGFLLSALWCGKRVVVVSQSLGPFKWYSRFLTRYCLNRTPRIYIREQRTSDLLRELGIEPSRIALAPDLAFCLPAASDERAREVLPPEVTRTLSNTARPVIGISVSCLVRGLETDGARAYVANMARIIAFINSRYHAVILLVPHVVTPSSWGGDDVAVVTDLVEIMRRRADVFALTGDLSASDIKAAIGRCNLFLAARMHAAIAALSSDVPTIMLSWSHKYAGLMEQIGLERFVWNIESPVEQLEQLIEEGWKARRDIRQTLRAYNQAARQMVRQEVAEIMQMGHAAQGARGPVACPETYRSEINQTA